jgi:hypothetical protein
MASLAAQRVTEQAIPFRASFGLNASVITLGIEVVESQHEANGEWSKEYKSTHDLQWSMSKMLRTTMVLKWNSVAGENIHGKIYEILWVTMQKGHAEELP